jgi:hypothetical protein
MIYDLLDPTRKSGSVGAGSTGLEIKVRAYHRNSLHTCHGRTCCTRCECVLARAVDDRCRSRHALPSLMQHFIIRVRILRNQEDKVRGIYVKGLKEVVVHDASGLDALMAQGNSMRTQVLVAPLAIARAVML